MADDTGVVAMYSYREEEKKDKEEILIIKKRKEQLIHIQ